MKARLARSFIQFGKSGWSPRISRSRFRYACDCSKMTSPVKSPRQSVKLEHRYCQMCSRFSRTIVGPRPNWCLPPRRIGEIGAEAKAAIPQLIRMLRLPRFDKGHRAALIGALGRMGACAEPAVPAILETLGSDPEPALIAASRNRKAVSGTFGGATPQQRRPVEGRGSTSNC